MPKATLRILRACKRAWFPHLVKDIEVLEKVQRAVGLRKLIQEPRKLEYNKRLKRLDLILTTLQRRRIRGDFYVKS